jgi:hypothetical protein
MTTRDYTEIGPSRVFVHKWEGQWQVDCTICDPPVSTLRSADLTAAEARDAGLAHYVLRHLPPEEVELEPIPERPDHA